jgi:hypothetical protein
VPWKIPGRPRERLCGSHFSPVAKFESALAQAAAGYDHDGIGGAAINLHKGDDAFAVLALRIVQTEGFEAEHGHAHAEHLSGAKVAMGHGSVFQILIERFHSGPSSSAASV